MADLSSDLQPRVYFMHASLCWDCGYCGGFLRVTIYQGGGRLYECDLCGRVVRKTGSYLVDNPAAYTLITPIQSRIPRSRLDMLGGCPDV